MYLRTFLMYVFQTYSGQAIISITATSTFYVVTMIYIILKYFYSNDAFFKKKKKSVALITAVPVYHWGDAITLWIYLPF